MGSSRETAGTVVALLAACGAAWFIGSDEFLFWDDHRFFLDDIAGASNLSSCLSAALTQPLFEAYHPVHAALLCLQRAAGPAPESLLATARWVSLLLALGLAAGWIVLGRSLGLARGPALLALALWCAHPAMVEVWANLASQKDLLGLSFFVLALAASRRVDRWWGRALVLLCTLLAGGSKSVYSIVGLVLLAEQLLGRERGHVKPPWWSIAAAIISMGWMLAAWTVADQHALAHPVQRSLDLLVVGSTLAAYLELMVWPAVLSPTPCLEMSLPRALVGLSAFAMLIVVALSRRSATTTRLGALVAALGLIPFANLIPTPFLLQLRYATLPLLGLSIAAAGGNQAGTRRARLWWVIVGVIVAVNATRLGIAAEHWQNRLALWSDAAKTSGNCGEPTPWLNLATARAAHQDWAGAELAVAEGFLQRPSREKTLRDWWLLILLRGTCGHPPTDPAVAAKLARSMPLELGERDRLPLGLQPAFSFLASCRAAPMGQLGSEGDLEDALSATMACDPERAALFETALKACSAASVAR